MQRQRLVLIGAAVVVGVRCAGRTEVATVGVALLVRYDGGGQRVQQQLLLAAVVGCVGCRGRRWGGGRFGGNAIGERVAGLVEQLVGFVGVDERVGVVPARRCLVI